MGFSSQDDFINEVSTNGKFLRLDWNKSFLPTTAAVAGEWHCLARGAGNPGADALYNTGTNLTFQPTSNSTTSSGSLILPGSATYPDTKHIINASAFSAAATTMPSILMLVDIIGFYRVTSVTTTGAQSMTNTLAQTTTFTADAGTDICTHSAVNLLTGTRVRLTTSGTLPAGVTTATDYYIIKVTDTTCMFASSYANAIAGTDIDLTDTGSGTHNITYLLPRYTNGAGVQTFIWNTNATAMGAATPTFTAVYLDSTSTSSTTPATVPIGKTAGANGLILYSGTGSGKYGPFMPLAAGDSGVAQVESINQNVSYVSGEYSIAMCKPLITMPMTTIGVASERDFMNQLPSLPRIYDGANLHWLLYSGANTPTNSSFYGHLDIAWG